MFYSFKEDTLEKKKKLIRHKQELNVKTLLENRSILLGEIKAINVSPIALNSPKMEKRVRLVMEGSLT